MRVAAFLAAAVLFGCAGGGDTPRHPDEAKWRADIQRTIKANGWDAECAAFEAMTPEQRFQAAGALIAFNVVTDAEGAQRYLEVSADECKRARP